MWYLGDTTLKIHPRSQKSAPSKLSLSAAQGDYLHLSDFFLFPKPLSKPLHFTISRLGEIILTLLPFTSLQSLCVAPNFCSSTNYSYIVLKISFVWNKISFLDLHVYLKPLLL